MTKAKRYTDEQAREKLKHFYKLLRSMSKSQACRQLDVTIDSVNRWEKKYGPKR